jgi:23S rRNA (adenine2503-C2)-methyltransferase
VTELSLAGERPAISEVSRAKLAAWLTARGEPAYRAEQILSGAHRPEVGSFDAMSDLPAPLRAGLTDAFRFSTVEASHVLEADGGLTAKAVHQLPDGQRVESVLMRYAGRDGTVSRTTVCISSQAG